MDGLIAWAVLIGSIVVLFKLLIWWWRYLAGKFRPDYRVPVYFGSLALMSALGLYALFFDYFPARRELMALCEQEAGVWIYQRAPEKVDGYLTNGIGSEPSLLEKGYVYYDNFLDGKGKYRRTYLGTNERGGWSPVDKLIDQPSRYEVVLERTSRSQWIDMLELQFRDRQTGALMAVRREFVVKLYKLTNWQQETIRDWMSSLKCDFPAEQDRIDLFEEVLPPSGQKTDFNDGKIEFIPPKVPEEN